MTRLSPWLLAWALVGACVGPKGEHGPTPVHPNSADPSGGERNPAEGAPHEGAGQQVAAPVAEASEAKDTGGAGDETPSPAASAEASEAKATGEAGAETPSPESPASAAPEQDAQATNAAGVDVDARTDAQSAPQEDPAPPAANPALVRRGRQVFTGTCMLCHDMGPRIAGLGWTIKRMERQIRRGGKRMSAISTDKLPNEKLQALMAYLHTIGAVRGDESSSSQVSRQ